jgi:hypothetical protein
MSQHLCTIAQQDVIDEDRHRGAPRPAKTGQDLGSRQAPAHALADLKSGPFGPRGSRGSCGNVTDKLLLMKLTPPG